jgi:sugar lactone lactonase YvrE
LVRLIDIVINTVFRCAVALALCVSPALAQSITTFAGGGIDDGRPAIAAGLANPYSVAVAPNGTIYIADTFQGRVRKVDPATQIIATVAGGGTSFGNALPATAASLNSVAGVALNRDASALYLADQVLNRVFRVDLTTGVMTAIADTGERGPSALAVDSAENVYFCERESGLVRKIAKDGTITTVASALAIPDGIAIDTSGNLYISESGANAIRKIDPLTLAMTTVVTGLNSPHGLAFDERGALYIADSANRSVRKLSGGALTTLADSLVLPRGLAVDASGNVLVADQGANRILRIGTTVTTIAGNGSTGYVGDGSAAIDAGLLAPSSMAIDADGNVIVADTFHNRIRRVDRRTGVITTIAGSDAEGIAGDGGAATSAALNWPTGVAISPTGELYVADKRNQRIRKIGADGRITTVAGANGEFQFAAASTPITGIAFDRIGNLYVADNENRRIQMISPAGVITTAAGDLTEPAAVAVDAAGNLFISDYGSGTIRRVDAATKAMTTIARDLVGPQGIAVDSVGNVYFVDSNENRVSRIDPRGVITTIAGTGASDYSGDRGPATAAHMAFPVGVAVDPSGAIFISERLSNRVRAIYPCIDIGAPAPQLPAQDESSVPTSPILSWRAVPNAFFYDVYLDTVQPPQKLVASDVSATRFAATNLEPLTTYYWRVVAKPDPSCGRSTASSSVRTFKTRSLCIAPRAFELNTPTQPTGGVTLAWQDAERAGSYDLYLGVSSPPEIYAASLTATNFVTTALVSGTTYFWTVVAHSECDATRTFAAPIRSFTTGGSCLPPGNFDLSAPSNGREVGSTATLSWTAATNAAAYDIYFGRSNPPPLYVSGTRNTSLQVVRLLPGQTYYWRVVARSPCGDVVKGPFSFTVASRCAGGGEPQFTYAPAGSLSAGTTYVIGWSESAGLDSDGTYLIERSLERAFSSVLDSQRTSSRFAAFVSSDDFLGGAEEREVFHRVRSIAGCDRRQISAASDPIAVRLARRPPLAIVTRPPRAVITSLGEKLEDRSAALTLENVGGSSVTIFAAPSLENQSADFVQLRNTDGDDGSPFIILEPRKPRSLTLRFQGPPNDRPANYEALVRVLGQTASALPIPPSPAYVNLRVGGSGGSDKPVFLVDGRFAEYASFPPPSGVDADQVPLSIQIFNPGDATMQLAAEIGPESWLRLPKEWNGGSRFPIPPRQAVPLDLFRVRGRAPSGSVRPRQTYLTLRTQSGASARILVEDGGDFDATPAPRLRLAPDELSYIIPTVVTGDSAYSTVRIANLGNDAVQTQLFFTPDGAAGFDTAVRSATVPLPPNDVVTLNDPIRRLFRATAAAGTVEIRAPQERLGTLTITSSVNTIPKAGGTFGYRVPVVFRGEGASLAAPHLLAGISASGNLVTNLVLAETSGIDRVAVRAALFDKDGRKRREDVVELPPYGRGVIPDVGGRILLTIDSGGGTVAGLAILTDKSTGSGATFISRPLPVRTSESEVLVVPLVMSGSWIGEQTYYRTQVAFAAGNDRQTEFRVTFNGLVRDLSLAAGTTTEYADVVQDLFGLQTQSRGVMTVQTTGGGRVYGRVYAETSAGVAADALPVLSLGSESLIGGGSRKPLVLDGLEHSVEPDRGSRNRLILSELAGLPARVAVRLYDPAMRTSPIVEQKFDVPAGGQLVFDNLFAQVGLQNEQRLKDRLNVQCVVESVSGTGLVAAVMLTTDNATGDAKFNVLVPAGAVETTALRNVNSVTGGRRRVVLH